MATPTAAEVLSQKYLELQQAIAGSHVTMRDEGKKIKESYHIGRRIDKRQPGAYAQVRNATHRDFGARRAVKSYYIAHPLLNDTGDDVVFMNQPGLSWSLIFKEIDTMAAISHQNCLQLYEVYFDSEFIHLVVELCIGGEVFDILKREKRFTEKKALPIFVQVLLGLNHMHQQGYIHRGITPENILFLNEDQNIIKIISYGSATKISQSTLTKKYGSPLYMSPEMYNGSYTVKCDVWSTGVLLYIMLIGYMPFFAETIPEISKVVNRGKIAKPREWKKISDPYKRLIKQLLSKEMGRPSLADLMNHAIISPVVAERQSRVMNKMMKRNSTLIKDTTTFNKLLAGNKLKHSAFKYLRSINCISADVEEAATMFAKFDTSGDGVISEDELFEGYVAYAKNKGEDITEEELALKVKNLLKRLDIAGNGVINYDEFLLLFAGDLFTQDSLKVTFDAFNERHNDLMTMEEIVRMGGHGEDLDFWQSIISDIDPTGKGGINFEEFCDLIQKYAD